VNDSKQPAGFWIRLCANLLDLILMVLLVVNAARLAAQWGWYIPIEITVPIAFAVYVIAIEGWTQQTLGKWFLGLAVMGKDGAVPRRGRLILRVTVGKVLLLFPLAARFLFGDLNRPLKWFSLLVLLVLSASFVRCAFDRRKRAWHDWIAGTVVIRKTPPFGRWSISLTVTGITVAAAWALGVPARISIIRDAREMNTTGTPQNAYEQRSPTNMIEAANLDEARLRASVEWLQTNAVSPVDYAVAKARQHPVLVFGESHGNKDALDWLNELIPQLYQRAGVTVLAMEVCLAEDNPELERLVTGRTFDRELAMKLARHIAQKGWPWGLKEYWDVFETVWRVNQGVSLGGKKMRIIGLESFFDQQSLALLDQESLHKQLPWWENMRRLQVLPSRLMVEARDLQMAARIEREIFFKHEHAIVWVGQAHAHACPSFGPDGRRARRMGALLRQKHEDDVFFIWLHSPDTPLWKTIEAIMKESGLQAGGFDLSASLFGFLRDSAVPDFLAEPRLALMDMADGYVYLKSSSQLTLCTWQRDYITPAMFAADKPFYQAYGKRSGHPLNSAAEANAFFQNTANLENK
jgi:uncharacterized RDD family membrane protein YckC